VRWRIWPACAGIPSFISCSVGSRRTGAGGAGRPRGFSSMHLAAAVGVELVVKSPVFTIEDNVRGTENVLAAAARAMGWGRVADVHVGGVWQERPGPVSGRRRSGNWSTDVAGAGVMRARSCLMNFWRSLTGARGSCRFSWRGCSSTVRAPPDRRYGMVLPRFVEQALRQRSHHDHGDGKADTVFLPRCDVVRALRGLPEQPRATGEVYNVGSTEEVTNRRN